MTVVHEKVASQRGGCVIVHATRAVRDVAEDDDVLHPGVRLEDVGEGRRVQQKTLGELKRERTNLRLAKTPHRLSYLERIVGGQSADGRRQVGVVRDVVRDLLFGCWGLEEGDGRG